MAIKVGIIGLEDNQSGVKTLLKILTFMPYDGYGRNTVHLNLRRPFKTANPRSIGFMRHAGEFVACDQYRFLSMILSYKKAHKDIPGDYLERSQAANNITDGIVLSNVFPSVPKHTIHDLVERYLQTLIKS